MPEAPRAVLLRPRVLRVVVLYVLARVPAAAVWLSVVLDVSRASGSYARAGLAVGAYGLGVAVCAPAVGRLADRRGARRVLLATAALQLPALLLLSASGRTAGVLLLAAFAAGAVQPPLVPCMRAGWAALVPDDDEREACFAFDSVLGEVVDLAAPLLAVALDVVSAGGGSLHVVAVAVAVTTVAYALVAPTCPRTAAAPTRRLDAVRGAGPVLLLVLLLTAALGAVEVAAVALADGLGERSAAGLLLGAFTGGGVVGGVLQARRGSGAPPARRLLVLLLVLGGGLSGAALVPERLVLLVPLLALAGTSVAPLVTVLLSCLQRLALPGRETETFTWATTANFVGVSGGSALAGAGSDAGATAGGSGGAMALLFAVGLAVVTALAVAVVAPRLPRQQPDDAAEGGDEEPEWRPVPEHARREAVTAARSPVGG